MPFRKPQKSLVSRDRPVRKTRGKPKVIVVVGPTASGKTALAHTLAKKFRGDIITADSRQVYQGLNIGTAKPHPKKGIRDKRYRLGRQKVRTQYALYFDCPEIRGVRHYGLNLVNPKEYFSVQQWKQEAENAIREIVVRGRVPIVEGGTWLWIWALTKELAIPEVPPNKKLRAKLAHRIAKKGLAQVVHALLTKDRKAAEFLDIRNPRRVIRAWEVMAQTKKKFSELRTAKPPRYDFLILGVLPEAKTLEKRIAIRLKKQLRAGLKKEAERLTRRFGWASPALTGIGYREWHTHAQDTAPHAIRSHTQSLARMQLRMFRRTPQVRWITTTQKMVDLTKKFLTGIPKA